MHGSLSTSSQADHSVTLSRLQSKAIADFSTLEVTGFSGVMAEPSPRALSLPADRFLLALARKGSVLFESRPDGRREVLAPSGALFVAGPVSASLQYARGQHDWVEMEWSRGTNRALSEWLTRTGRLNEEGGAILGRSLVSVEGRNGSTVGHLTRVLNFPSPMIEAALWSLIWDVVSEIVTSECSPRFASLPHETPSALASLADDVRSRPERSWTLKDAAEVAGYSPFHLSRTFRNFLEYGFPEYVERCRVERALGQVLGSSVPVEEVSKQCGFGSTQAMRDAFRHVVGFLPSELRSIPVAST